MNELALFAGIGGGILGTQLLGHRCVCAVENDPHAQSVLLARQNDGLLPTFPIWDDVTTFDGKPWRGIVDIISGGFPCQDISSAGKGAGITGERSGLWKEMLRIIGEVRPRFAFIENSPVLRTRGLGTILKDLAEIGYNAEWGIVSAGDVGAPHKRERMWLLAHTNESGVERAWTELKTTGIDKRTRDNWKDAMPAVLRIPNGVPHRVDRIERLGNAQVPAVARLAFQLLTERMKSRLTNDVPDTTCG